MPTPHNSSNDRRKKPTGGDRPEGESQANELQRLIEKVTGGTPKGLEELLRRVLGPPVPVLRDEDAALVIPRKNAFALHASMNFIAEWVKESGGPPLDRSNVETKPGGRPHKSTIPLLCEGIARMLVILDQRNALIEASARAALEHASRNTELLRDIKASEERASDALAKKGLEATEVARLEAMLAQLAADKAEAEAVSKALTTKLLAAQTEVSELETRLADSGCRLGDPIEQIPPMAEREDRSRLTDTEPKASPGSTIAVHRDLTPATVAELVEKSPKLRLALRELMSAAQRARTAVELKDPNEKFLALFDNSEIKELIALWVEVWQKQYQSASPFAADIAIKLALTDQIFRSQVNEDGGLSDQLKGFNLVLQLGKTATRSLIESATTSSERLKDVTALLGFDPRFLALLVKIKPPLYYLRD